MRRGFLNEKGTIVVGILFVFLAALMACILPGPAHGDPVPEAAAVRTPTQIVEAHVRWFFRNVNPQRMQKPLELVPIVVEVSQEHHVDPLLVATMIDVESSWRPTANGAVGEQGLLQVHGMARKGFDMETPRGQLQAGVTYLVASHKKCKTIVGALRRYQTGQCKSTKGSALYRARRWQQARKRQGLKPLNNPFSL